MCNLLIKIISPLKFKLKLLTSLYILLVSCPLLGQANNRIEAHLIEERLYFRLNSELLDQPMLFVRHDIGSHQVVWSKNSDYILLTIEQITSSSGVIIPLNFDYHDDAAIIGKFPIIKAKSTDESYYIDVTDLLLNTTFKWNLESPEDVIAGLSYIDCIHYLENELVITTKRTIASMEVQKTNEVDFSFYFLPSAMSPRLFDHRMGYFCEDEFSTINNLPVTAKANISRWRLEKYDKDEQQSDTVQPITFYFDTDIPDKWKPYIRKGVLEWLPAFDAAGFKNAIQVKDIPHNDTTWCNNSVHHSMIRWANFSEVRGSEDRGASTVNKIVDFRSGEILKSDIILGSSYQYLAEQYMVRCAPLDGRAQQYPFPDDLLGELLQFVTAHEAGHAFGIKDANYGEYTYPLEKMRDKQWLQTMGHTPSIMNYARHNYIVQPEDNISPSLLIQKVGPADYYQILWGYTSIPKGLNETHYLEKIIREQDTIPWYRYNNHYFKTIGPGDTNEVVDNNDPIGSTQLGLKNIKRVMELLPLINSQHMDNDFLDRSHGKIIELWYHEMSQIMSLIGGYSIQYKSGSQTGEVFTPIPAETQLTATKYLINNAFDVPDWLSNPSYSSRILYSSGADTLMEYQLKLLSDLMDPYRMKRLEEMEHTANHERITEQVFKTMSEGLFRESKNGTSSQKKHSQELQEAYVNNLIIAIEQEKKYKNIKVGQSNSFYDTYGKSVFMAELLKLEKEIEKRLKHEKDKYKIAHLTMSLIDIKKLLNW